MQNCIGAIDGTHIPITIPLKQQEPYRNRKQGLSQNMMVACDFDVKFVHVHAGWEGSAQEFFKMHLTMDLVSLPINSI